MVYTIAVAGKGGVGKTTVAALLVQQLLKIDRPVLAVDADPNSNFNLLLGLDYAETVSDIREEARNLSSASLSKSDFFSMRLEEAITEGNGVDLLVMGRPEGTGCYCAVNNILREHLSKLSKNYKFVVIDNEAGMEHLSRRTAGHIDILLLVSDSTKVGIQAAINTFNTAKKADLQVKSVSLVINKSRKELGNDQINSLEKAGLTVAGYVPYSEGIEKNSEKGSRLEINLVQGEILNKVVQGFVMDKVREA
ncbi:MAG: AAA family ATPase [Candidatus Omnitrophica bacterium]|nr:AAA family ATPase [Candidatus Omnitrophota bacterium]